MRTPPTVNVEREMPKLSAPKRTPTASSTQSAPSGPNTSAPNPQDDADSLESAPRARGRGIYQEKMTEAGQNPALASMGARRPSVGGASFATPPNTPAAPPAAAPDLAETNAALGETPPPKTPISTVSQLKSEDGILSFVLHVPSSTPGAPEQSFRISVLGGQRADIAMLNATDMAVHLTQAIALVQGDPATKGFSAITFEGRLGEEALAKAVVHKGKTSFILGGNRHDRVAGSEKIFSDELDRLLTRLQETLAARHRHTRIERLVPEAETFVTPPTSPTSEASFNADFVAQDDSELEGLYGPTPGPKARSNGPERKVTFSDVDSESDAEEQFFDAPEIPDGK